jgi:hypothetical protein
MPPSVAEVLSEPGLPLEGAAMSRLGPAIGVDLSSVRVHVGGAAARAAVDLGAAAWTSGDHVVFARDAYRPGTPGGDRLIAHELAHVAEQRGMEVPVVARSVEEWLETSRPVAQMQYTELLFEADELQQWLERQTASSQETIRIEEVLEEIRAEIARRDARAAIAGRPPRRPRRGRRAAAEASATPDRRPQILTRMTSVLYTDPAEMRAEYDLIIEWLMRSDLPSRDRRILETERANLFALLQGERQRVAGQRSADRLRLALSREQDDQAAALAGLAKVIEGISADSVNPELFYIYDRGERIPISRAQGDSLRATLHEQLNRARQVMSSSVDYYYGRYKAQREINEDQPIVSAISGWLGGVRDPGAMLAVRVGVVQAEFERMRVLLQAGRLSEASAVVASLERDTQIIRAVSRAFYEGYIDGAETAVTVLEVTRDVSFAVAGSIGAVVAAPFVAGAVGAGGLGITGAAGTGLTIVGTGAVVGTGAGVVRGGSAALGVVAAGGTADEALAALRTEGTRGAVEGFLAGAGGSAARALAPALGVGAQVGGQAARRIATDAIVNSSAAVIDALVQGASIEEAASAGLRAAALSVPGGLVGGNTAIARRLVQPLTNSAVAYAGAIASGAPREAAIRAATVALASGLATGSVMERRAGEQARYEQAGRNVGRSIRSTAIRTTAAVAIGTGQIIPPTGGRAPSVAAQTAAVSGVAAGGILAPPPGARPATPPTTEVAAPAPVPRATVAPTAAPETTPAPARPAATEAPSRTTSPTIANVETEVGMTAAARTAARASFGANLTSPANASLGAAWNSVANPGENTILNQANSRRLFNNQRNRFWRAVRRDPAALQVIRNMGGTFPEERSAGALDLTASSAPEINLPDNVRLPISLDHEIERQTAPQRALDPNNLRLSTLRENTVLLRQLHEQDPFVSGAARMRWLRLRSK